MPSPLWSYCSVTVSPSALVVLTAPALAKISAAIHVYDGNFLEIQRSMWNAETLVEEPYDINVVVQGMSLQKHDRRKSAAA